jgi:hypothetical protein
VTRSARLWSSVVMDSRRPCPARADVATGALVDRTAFIATSPLCLRHLPDTEQVTAKLR